MPVVFRHLSKKHNQSSSKETVESTPAITAVCQMCKRVIKRDYQSFYCHIKTNCSANQGSDKIDCIQYYFKFVKGKSSTIDEDEILRKDQIESEAQEWIRSNVHRCKLCKFESADSSKVVKHLLNQHGLKGVNQLTMESTPAIHTRCQMCQKIFKRDVKALHFVPP